MADGTITLNWTRLGKTLNNVLVFSNFGSDADFAESVAEELETPLTNILETLYGDYLTLNSMLFTFNPGPGQWSYQTASTWMPLTGSGTTGQPCANQTRVLVSTNYAGTRPNRGKCHFPGGGEDFCTNGLWASAMTDPLQDLLTDWATNGISSIVGNIFLRIARRTAVGSITLSNPVDACIGRTSPSTQRRGRL